MNREVYRSENDLLVFISSRMNDVMEPARLIAVDAIKRVEFGRPWAFECTPASSESADDAYLRKVREADFVVWLVGSETTQPVINEINEAIASARKMLVFKLPVNQRDSLTQEMIDQVGIYAKWEEVGSIEDLSKSITEAFSDEIVRAVRNPLAPGRRQKLLQDARLSISRCKEALVSLGVDEAVAEEMANERERGNSLKLSSPGVYTVVGEQGSGKTFAVERLFQAAAVDAGEDSSCPFPIFIRARDLTGPVNNQVEERLRGYTDSYNPRVLLLIDGVDEIGSSRGMDIFHQLTAYAGANPEATVVSTARSLPGLTCPGQLIVMEPLKDDESLGLLEKVLGRSLDPPEMHRWPQSIRDARRLPLLTVMIGALLRHSPDLTFTSPGQIIGQVADLLLKQVEDNSEELDRLLQQLAVQSTNSGTRVQGNSITAIRARQALLRNSRLVEGDSDSLDFALPIFREWYAARALIEGTVGIESLRAISDRWIPSLSVVLGAEVDETGKSLLAHLISSDPGLAGLLLKDNTPDQIQFYGKIPPQETAQAAGASLREAMALWSTGLEDLYNQIGPSDAEGEVSTLALELSERYLTTSWHAGQAELPPIVELTDYLPDRRPNADWRTIRTWEISQGLTGPSWWSYFKTQSQLSDSLEKVLRIYSLAIDSPDFRRELAWNFVLEALGHGELGQQTFGVGEVAKLLSHLGPNAVVGSYRGRDYRPRDLEVIAEHLSALIEQGAEEIGNPWPSADLPIVSGPIWNIYSDEQLLERTKAIYSGALRIYSFIVERWFPRFSNRLHLYRTLPVRLEGWLTPSALKTPREGGWPLDWYFRILPADRHSEVSIELRPGNSNLSHDEFFNNDDLYQQEALAFDAHRPGLPGEFSLTTTSSALSELLHPYPATELANSWLRGDLKDYGW